MTNSSPACRCLLLVLLAAARPAAAADAKAPLRFDFGPGAAAPGFVAVAPDRRYDDRTGYGFEPGVALEGVDRGGDPLRGDFVTAAQPFKFSVAVPAGNYRVTVTLGDARGVSTTTVKAEARRLMLERIRTAPGEFATRSFMVNVRTPALSAGNRLKLDTREVDPRTQAAVTLTWDDRLTLQFDDARPCVCAVELERVDDAITVFLVGDSTVTDQPNEPTGTWGQMLPRWFKPPVTIANHAESGETLKAFRAQGRWFKVMSELKAGDYVFLQFGHNDLNRTGHDGIWPRDDTMGDWVNTYAEADTDYKWLLAAYAVEVRRRGGIPVIVTPMTKVDLRTGEVNAAGLDGYPAAAAAAAKLAGAACIDLNGMTVALAGALGPRLAPRAYVDGLHSNAYGGYLFSRCIVEGIRRAGLGLADHLVDDAGDFDPAHPAPLPDAFTLPPDPHVPYPPPAGFAPRAGVPAAR